MDKGERESRGGGGGGTEDQWTDCQNPQQVLYVGPRSDDSSTTFTGSVDERSGTTLTTTTFFRVNYDVNFSFLTPSIHRAEIRIEDGFGNLVESVTPTQDTAGSFFVNRGAGTYLLGVDIEPEHGATYTVTVDECSGTTPAPPDKQRVRERLDRIERRLDRIERRLDRIEGHGERPGGDRGERPRGDRGGGHGRG